MHLNGEGLVIDFIVDLRILLQRLFDKILINLFLFIMLKRN